MLEGLPPVGVEEVAAASGALAALIKAWCGGASPRPSSIAAGRRRSWRVSNEDSGCGIAAAGLALTLLASGPALAAPEVLLAVDLHGATGWSLVLRCRARKDDRALSGVAVQIEGSEGFAPPGERPVKGVSAASGLALFSSLSYSLAEAAVEHSAFARVRVSGLSASPGTFAFRDVELAEGAGLRATVTVDGQPGRDVKCQLLDPIPIPRGPAPEPRVHFETVTDARGVCSSRQLPEGALHPPSASVDAGRSFVDRSVNYT